MTELGAKFLKGESVVHTRKLVENGEIIDRDQKSLRHVNEFRGKIPKYSKNLEYVLPRTSPSNHWLPLPIPKVASINQEPI